MADNVTVDNGTGTDYSVASDKVTYSGDADQAVQLVKLVAVEGAEGSKTPFDVYVDPVTGGFIGLTYTETGGPVHSADSVSDSDSGAAHLAVVPSVWNGSGFDRVRGNTGGVFVNGQVAHDVADTGNPIKIGGKAVSSAPSPVAAGDRVDAYFDLTGRQIVSIQAGGADPGAVFIGGADSGQSADVTGTSDAAALNVGGNRAHDATDSGHPIKIGGRADDGARAAVAVGDRVDASFTTQGALRMALVDPSLNIIGGATGYYANVTGTGSLDAENALNVGGNVAHDATDEGNPIKIGGKANAAAPTDVTANNERVDAWFLRNGSQATTVTAAGALIGGDATNGLDVDVTRLPALVASSANIGDVDVLTLPGITGAAAHASPTSGNPVFIAGRASAVIPTDVGADGDAAGMWTNRNGAQMVSTAPHIGLNSDPWNLVHEGAQYTSAQTSTVLVAGGASEKLVVTKVQIQAYATTAGTAILYFGTGAYSRGTNRAVFDGEFAPSSTSKPGVVLDGPFIAGTNGDDLMVTTTNALSITFSVWYYVIT